MPRKLAGNAAPEYPADAYRNGDEGLVYLLVEIGATGTVSKVTVYRTSGFASLDEAARKAVIQWKFRLGVLNKTNVACRAVVPVRFQIQ
jgi:protein TonB